jgi:tetratricopeptide (TPR) repeat protein
MNRQAGVKKLAGLVLAITIFGATHAMTSEFTSELMQGVELHDAAVAGDKKTSQQAIEHFEKMLEADPDNELARVYLGSSWTLRSRDMGLGPGKMDALKKGGRLMDEAVNNAPQDIPVRLVRAINYLQLPAIFGKRDTARSELQAIMTAIGEGKTPAARDLPVEVKQVAFYYGAQALEQLKKKDRARQAYQTALDYAPASDLAPELRRVLREG